MYRVGWLCAGNVCEVQGPVNSPRRSCGTKLQKPGGCCIIIVFYVARFHVVVRFLRYRIS